MGCTCSSPVDRATEEDLVGGVGRTLQQVKAGDIPQERDAMVALEVAASRKTIYRKRMRQFKPNGTLDFNKNVAFLHLRNLLDEPVGRFYLKEFAQEKKFPEMFDLVEVWVAIQHLKSHKELSLETVMRIAEMEDQAKDEPVAGKGSTASNGPSAASSGEEEQPNSDRALPDKTESEEQLYGYPIEYPSDEEILKLSTEVVETFLVEGTKQGMEKYLEKSLVLSAAAAAKAAIKDRLADELRTKVFVGLQNAAFIRLIDGEYHSKFREHSEYKRYKLKYQRCYNTVSHRDFDFMATLGKGSFGRVLRVRKKTTGAQFALKVMSKKKILSGAESTEQVTIERHVLVVCDCPSIVKVEFAFQTSRALFLALELLEGGTLVDAMKSHPSGVLSIEEARFITAQMVLGLEHLHKHGILYRDLKPANVLLDRKGNAVLTDMGLAAKFRDSRFPKEEGGVSSYGSRLVRRKSMTKLKPEELKCVGTYGYRAPEVLSCSETKTGYDEVIDYWALGVTVFFLMYSKLPFSKKAGRKSLLGGQLNPKDQEKRMQKEPLSLPKDMEPDVKSFIEGLLELDPKMRLGRDVVEVKAHPFFSGLDFEQISKRAVKPVYRPRVAKRDPGEAPTYEGLMEAMQQFTQDNVLELFGGENEMNDEYTHVNRKDQRLFREWEFIPDSLLESDWSRCGEDILFN